jgi:hypothetical protein
MARRGATTHRGINGWKTEPGLWVRLALGLLSALLLLADGTGAGQLRLAGDPGANTEAKQTARCGEVDCGDQASRLEGLAGVPASAPAHRFEKTGPSDHPSSCRARAREWAWTAFRRQTEVQGVIRQFGLSAWRQRNGHVSDRPLIFTFPAQGPPAAA